MALILDYFEKKNWRVKEYKFWIKFIIDMVFIILFLMILFTIRDGIIRIHTCDYKPEFNESLYENLINASITEICVCHSNLNIYENKYYDAYKKASVIIDNAFDQQRKNRG